MKRKAEEILSKWNEQTAKAVAFNVAWCKTNGQNLYSRRFLQAEF